MLMFLDFRNITEISIKPDKYGAILWLEERKNEKKKLPFLLLARTENQN
jgi:hypothetical protein